MLDEILYLENLYHGNQVRQMGTAQSLASKGWLQSCSPYLGPSVITSNEQGCCYHLWLWESMGTRIKSSRRISTKFSTEEIQQLLTAWILQRYLCQNPSLKIALKSRDAIEFSHEDRSKKKKIRGPKYSQLSKQPKCWRPKDLVVSKLMAWRIPENSKKNGSALNTYWAPSPAAQPQASLRWLIPVLVS